MNHNQYEDLVELSILRGVVQRVSAPDFEGWVRGALRTEEKGIVYFAGPVVEIDTGMQVELAGHYDPENSKRFTAFKLSTPRTANVALGQLMQARIRGFGPARAAKHCVPDRPTSQVLDDLYSSDWSARLEVRTQPFNFPSRDRLEGMLHLYTLGYPTRVLNSLSKRYGDSVSVRPRTAPYSFVLDRAGVSFFIEDLVQKRLGKVDAEVRTLAAGTALEDWTLADLDGHTLFVRSLLIERLSKILGTNASEAKAAFVEHLAGATFHQVGSDWSPTVLATAEVRIAKRVYDAKKKKSRVEAPVLNLSGLDAKQQEAVQMAFSSKFSVITGGPGTGKTTSIRVLVREAHRLNYNIRLLAPTGKAARRMSEVSGQNAYTIHRYLPRDTWGDTTSPDDLIVIDEASMVDAPLMAQLLKYAPDAQIVCVGDANQLPSVGPGAVLEDLVNSANVRVTRLETIHRSAESSWMVKQAPKILRGELPLTNTKDFKFTELKNPNELVEQCVHRITKNPDCQILSPRRTGPLGTDVLNSKIQRLVHKESDPRTSYNDYVFYEGDPVVAVANDYDNQIFNGDMGVVLRVAENAVKVSYSTLGGTHTVEYVGPDLGYIQPAYVLSVHRYQGSEARHVVVLCHSQMGPTILTRRLMYTAVTRAKEKLEILGDKLGVQMAISTETKPRRTALGLFLSDSASWPKKIKENL